MLKMRSANVDESETLINIAIKSVSFCSYDCDYIEKINSIYNVTEEAISNKSIFDIVKNSENYYGIICLLAVKTLVSESL